ncbi:hypothetical protein OEA41_001969 [Lepraria neglecta]|uniref:Uncharacterized protein n=1 Tax=Lepraria neglecta TaxID=209136 RepID=A0AAE0DPH7_9LECA|nr:hypothetical protein OEA41_001969 [Lepraria neglecta]
MVSQGLKATRRFKKHTMWFRRSARFLARCANISTFGLLGSNTKSLAWDWMTKDDRIWNANLQIIDGRTPTSETLEAGTIPPSRPFVKQNRSYSNDTTLAGSIHHVRTHATSVHKPSIEENLGIQMQILPRIPSGSSPSTTAQSAGS